MKKELLSAKEVKVLKGANLKCHFSIPILLLPITFLIILRLSVINPKSFDDFIIGLLLIIFSITLIYFLFFKKIINNIKIRKNGDKVKANVIGYYDDKSSIGDEHSKNIELSINTSIGNQIIRFSTDEKFKIGSEIELIIYNDNVLINDKKINKIEKIHNILLFTLMTIIVCLYTSDFIVYRLFNTTYYDMKMSIILMNNKEILTTYNNLEYKIPDDYKLIEYKKDSEYNFESKNDRHDCQISIYILNSKIFDNNINKCQYYKYNELISDEEIIINNSKWCFGYIGNNRFEHYYQNNGEHYYSISLRKIDDSDEKCSLDFPAFIDSLKINNQ